MEQACQAIAHTDYFKADQLATKALIAARKLDDFATMARICLPLLEARRQIRQQALDAGMVALVKTKADLPKPLKPGCYFLKPPMIGRDGHTLRASALRRRVPVSVLTREPLTRKGLWPIVATGPLVVRLQVTPPWPVKRVESSISKDDDERLPSIEWFAATSQALGDAAIRQLDPNAHPHWRVDDLLDVLDAHSENEQLIQALAQVCKAAVGTPPPTLPRQRSIGHPYSF